MWGLSELLGVVLDLFEMLGETIEGSYQALLVDSVAFGVVTELLDSAAGVFHVVDEVRNLIERGSYGGRGGLHHVAVVILFTTEPSWAS